MEQAILEISGDPVEVLQRYARQLSDGIGEPDDTPGAVTKERAPDGRPYLSLSYGPEGGGGVTFRTDTSERYVRVTWSSD